MTINYIYKLFYSSGDANDRIEPARRKCCTAPVALHSARPLYQHNWLDKKKAGGLHTPADFEVLETYQPPIVVAYPLATNGLLWGVDSCGYALMA